MKKLLLFTLLLFLFKISFSQGTETFTTISGTTSSYISRSWTGNDGSTWTATNSRTDQTINGPAITMNDDVANTYVQSGTIAGGVGDLTITTQRKFAGGSGSLDILINGSSVGTVPYGTAAQTTTISGINISGNIVIRVDNNIGGSNSGGADRVAIDDLTWTAFAGSSPLLVASPTSVSGLDYVFGAGPSLGLSYALSGTNLSPASGSITVNAPSNFSISTTLGGTYTSSISLSYTGATLSSTDIFVRLDAGLALGTYGPLNITNSGGGASTVNVAVSGEVTPAPPSNNDCAGATPLTLGSSCTFSSYTNVNATNSGAPAPGCGSYSGGDVWFSIVVPPSGIINFEAAANGGITDGAMALYSGTCGSLTLIECDDDDGAGSMPQILSTGLTPGSTVYLVFWEFGGNVEGTFDLCAWTPAACATPTNQASSLNFSGITGNSIDVSFLASSPAADSYLVVQSTSSSLSANPVDGSSYSISDVIGGGTVVFNGSGTSFTASGLSPTTSYYYYVFAYNDASCAGGPSYLSPPLSGNATTISGPCLSQLNFTSTPIGWAESSITYASNEANFASTTGELTTIAISNPTSLTFDLRRTGNTSAKTLFVEVSTTTQGGTYTTIATYNHGNTTASGTTAITVDLSAYTAFSNVYIKFRKASSTSSPWYLRNVEVYCGAATPEIDVQGNSLSIADGDATPDVADDTEFGNVAVAVGSVAHTFTVENTGGADLSVSSITSSNNAEFTISGTTSGTVTAGNSFTFTITFDPNTSGIRNSTITINSDDSDEGTYDFVVQGTGTAIPDIALSSTNPAVAGSNIIEGSNDNVIYMYALSVTTFDATFTGFDFTTSGTASSSNITNFKAYYSTDASFDAGSDVFLDNITSGLGAGSHSFTGFSQTIANGTTGYIFITTDLPCPSTAGNTIIVDAITTADLTFVSGNKTGSAFASGTHTIADDVPVNVSALTTSSCSNGSTTISWTDATGCFDNYLVVASLSSLVTAPSGNGIAYTPDAVFGNGTAYDDGYVVYEASGTSVTVSGLTNGTNYTYTVFTRNGTTWSSGVEVSCTPSLTYCTAASTNSSFEYIEGVELNTINNSSGATNYSDFTGISTTLERGDSYILTVYVGDFYTSDSCLAWIDWNFDGVFDPITEKVLDGFGSAPFTTTLSVPVSANLTTTTMRIRLYDSGAGTSNATPCGTHTYGEVEDYSITIVEPCVPTHTVSSFSPASGPSGTIIEITGTGFTDTTTVNVNGIAASVSFVSSTTLNVEVPSGNTNGPIDVIEAACDVQAGSFGLIEASGACGASSSFTDLIISEIYDGDVANVFYVELYNPTTSDIDLDASGTDYTLKIDNRDSGDPGISIDRTIDLTGVVPAGGTFLLNLGTSSNTCSNSWDFILGGNGINDYDYVFLALNGTDVDRVNLASQSGYTFKRDLLATGPTTSYSSADWDILLTEDCADLGVFAVSTNPSPTLSDIVNLSSCNFVMGTVATEGDLSTIGDLTYTWYYNDGLSPAWTAVSATSPPNLTISGETSDTLLISNGLSNLSSISGFQFYCEVDEAASCKNISNAASFIFAPEPYFRTLGGGASAGDWNDETLWEMSADLVTWSSACVYPTATNSDSIIIQSGDSIAIVEGVGAPDITADQVYVSSGGKLLIDESAEFHLDNGNVGADILVDGVLMDVASSGVGNGLTFLNSATWALGANGTIIKTFSSSVNDYRDNYEGGIANIPATAHWAYVNLGQGSVAVAAIDMYYPNLYFESVVGNYDASGLNEVLRGASGYTTVKGDLSIGLGTISAGTGTYKVYNNNFNAQEMLILGDVYIGLGSELTNASYNGGSSSSHDNGTGLEVKGSLAIDGTLDNTNGSGNTILSGTNKQDVVSASGSGTFNTYDFELDNSSHAELLDIDLIITNELTFTNGKIITDVSLSDMVFVQNEATSAIVGGATSGADRYVEGKLQWTTDGASAYTFPVGHSTQGAQALTIDLTGASGSDILAFLEANTSSPTEAYAYCDLETHPGGGTVNAGNGNAGYDGILDQVEFNLASPLQWDVTNPGGGITSYDLTVLANGGQDISPVTTANGVEVRYLMKNGEPGNSGVSTGQGLPSFTATGFLACPNQYALTGLTSFSKFTLDGASQSNTTLPVELLYFDAQALDGMKVLCTWATVTEINNDFFTVERSEDGQEFIAIGEVQGAGNYMGTLYYELKDEEALRGVSYYRLKQTDFDGSVTYSQIVAVNFNSIGESFQVYPTPFESSVVLSYTSDQEVSYTIFDIKGKLIMNGSFVQNVALDLSSFASGSYFIKLSTASSSETIKLLKK